MLTLQMPMLLALLGTALMAVVIFAPSRVPAPVTTSFAPPPAPPAIDRWEPPAPVELWEPLAAEPAAPHPLAWPALVDPCAAACDAAARLGLIEALAAVRTSWSQAILCRALDEEPDPTVREAVVTALRA